MPGNEASSRACGSSLVTSRKYYGTCGSQFITDTAGKSVWMVYLFGSELGSLLRHGIPYCTLHPLPFVNPAVKQRRKLMT